MSPQSTRCDSLRCRHPQIVAAGPYPSCASISITTCNFTSSMRAALCYTIPFTVPNASATNIDEYSPCGGTETGRDREHHRPHRAHESQTALRPSVLALLVYLFLQTGVLTMIVARYRVEVKDEPQFRGETFQQRKRQSLKYGSA